MQLKKGRFGQDLNLIFAIPSQYFRYSLLSLSRLRLSRIAAYLKMKIWSLFKNENLKILWKRGEIAPREDLEFLLFSTIFSIHL